MIHKFRADLVKKAEQAEATIKKWHDAFLENTDRCLGAADHIYKAAAEKRVYVEAVYYIDMLDRDIDNPMGYITSYATDQALQQGSYLAQSTSPTSNLYDDHVRAAWARVARYRGLGL